MDNERQSQIMIPIACRIVASDQWLTTQFDAALKISEVKRYILTKVYNNEGTTDDYLFSRDRPISPIIFAAALPTPDSLDNSTEDSHEDEHPTESESRFPEATSHARGREAQNQRIASPTAVEEPTEQVSHAAMMSPHHYQMLAFSTSQLLEDDYTLAWYGLRPHELLELHPPGRMVRLPRDVMLEYVQPYLELDVRALRVVVNAKDAYYTPYLQDVSPNKIKKPRDHSNERRGPSSVGPGAPPSVRKRRKMKLEWRDRYLVIRQGMLSLFKSRSDLTPIHTCLLSSLTTLRGQEDIAHAAAALPSPHIVCAKFREEVPNPNVPDPQLSSSPTTEQWSDPWSGGTLPRENDGGIRGKRDSKESIKQHRGSIPEEDKPMGSSIPKEDQHEHRTPEHGNENLWNEINAADGTQQGIWIVLDTLNGFALSHLLRVLHRFCPSTVSSTLIPSYLLLGSSLSSSPSSTSPPCTPQQPPYPYPEWRMEVSQRAQKAGLGDVSEAMSWIMWGGSSEAPPAPKLCDPKKRKKDSPLPTEDSGTVPDSDADDANGDEGDYELEWDSWPNDLARQARSGTDKHITVTVPERSEPSYTHGLHVHDRFGIGRSTSNMSLSAQLGPVSPAVRDEILSSANMDLLSVDSPALLTAPSVLPLQSSGVTTSTVSVGGVVRARSLMSGKRGVARAMDIPADDSGKLPCSRKQRAGKQKRTHEEHSLNASATSSMTSMRSSGFSPTSTVRSTVSTLEVANDMASMPTTVTTSTVTTSATISSGSRRSSAAAETQRPEKGKGKGLKSGLTFSAERLMSKIESGWIS